MVTHFTPLCILAEGKPTKSRCQCAPAPTTSIRKTSPAPNRLQEPGLSCHRWRLARGWAAGSKTKSRTRIHRAAETHSHRLRQKSCVQIWHPSSRLGICGGDLACWGLCSQCRSSDPGASIGLDTHRDLELLIVDALRTALIKWTESTGSSKSLGSIYGPWSLHKPT